MRLSDLEQRGFASMRIAFVAALLALATSFAAQAETPRQRVMSIPLDMPLEEDLDGEFLEGIYQEKLLGELKDSVLIEAPVNHITSNFTEGRNLELWFSSREDGRRIFWVNLAQTFAEGKEQTPQNVLQNFEATYGKPDILRETKSDIGGSWVALKIDPRLADDRRAAILRQLEASFQPTPDELGNFLFLDMRDRARLLGVDFRGAILSFSAFKGKVAAQRIELLDLVRAHSVLNLTQ
jgi:hypothetical protein